MPQIRALIVAHGQPSAPDPAETRLAALRDRVQAEVPEVEVQSATLAKPDALEQQLRKMDATSLVYPLFMTPGFFIKTLLPKRLGAFDGTVMDCLGQDPDLPAIAADTLLCAAEARGWDMPEVLLAAHGSARGPVPAQATEAFADQLRGLMPGTDIRTGFVEQAPRVVDAATGLGKQAICLPFFALEGDHVRDDVAGALTDAGFTGALLGTLGEAPTVPALIARRLTEAAIRPPGE